MWNFLAAENQNEVMPVSQHQFRDLQLNSIFLTEEIVCKCHCRLLHINLYKIQK